MDADAERLLEVCEAEDIDTVREVVTNDIEEQAQEESSYTTRVRCGVET